MPRKPAAPDLSPILIEAGPSITRVRGPRAKDGRVYWRARQGDVQLWTGWATREEATAVGARLILGQKADVGTIQTVRDVLELWFGACEDSERAGQLATRSLETMRAAVRALLRELGPVHVDALSVTTLERYRDTRLRQGNEAPPKRQKGQRGRLPRRAGMAPETVARELRMLRTAWSWGHERGLVPSPTLPRVRVRMRSVVDRYTPTPEEVGAVLDHLEGWPWLAVRLLEATGCRLGEIATLRRQDVDASQAILRVVGKTGPREVVILPEVLADLLPWLPAEPNALVLGVTPESARTSLRRYLAEACTAAKCRRWSAHGLRRLAVRRLYRAGYDPGAAADHLGHSEEVALKHYYEAAPEDRIGAIRRAGLGLLPVAADREGGEGGEGGDLVLLGVASREAEERALVEAARRGDLAEVARLVGQLHGTETAQAARSRRG